MAGFGRARRGRAVCGRAECGWAGVRQSGVGLLADETGKARDCRRTGQAARPLTASGRSCTQSECEPILTQRTPHPPHAPIPAIAGPPCEPILTQRRRHSSHWHHCTVADGRPAHVKSYESRGTYPTTHTTCGTSPQKAQDRRHLASCVRHDIRNSPDTNRQ